MMKAGRQGLQLYVDKDYNMMLENYMVDYYCEEKIGGGSDVMAMAVHQCEGYIFLPLSNTSSSSKMKASFETRRT